VAEDSSAKPKVVKKSTAQLPFHVPFLYKGADSSQQQQQQQSVQPSAPQQPQQ
jgi:hypothetical protein